MANPMEIFQQLETIPDSDLIGYINDPNSQIPKYAALDEMQKRTNIRKSVDASGPLPESTIADEVMEEFATTSPGLQGAMAQSSGTLPSPPNGLGNMAPPSPQMGMPSPEMPMPEMPMQMAAGGGLTGYATGGRTGYVGGGQTDYALPANMPIPALAARLGVSMTNADGSPKDPTILQSEIQTAFNSANRPAVAPTYEPIDLSNTGIGDLNTSPLEQIAARNLQANPQIDLSQITPATPPVTSVGTGDPVDGAQRVIDIMNRPELRSDVNAPEYTAPAIPQFLLDNEQSGQVINPSQQALLDTELSARNFYEVSDLDRQNEKNTMALATLAKAFGTSKNLGEAGAMLGEGALGLGALKKAQRAEQRNIEGAKRADQLETFGFADAKNKIRSAITDKDNALSISLSNIRGNIAKQEYDAGIKGIELEFKGDELALSTAKSIYHDEVLMKSYLVQSDSNLLKIVTELGKERKDLLEIGSNRRSPAETLRLTEIQSQVQNIIHQVVGKSPDSTSGSPAPIDASALFNTVP